MQMIFEIIYLHSYIVCSRLVVEQVESKESFIRQARDRMYSLYNGMNYQCPLKVLSLRESLHVLVLCVQISSMI